MAHIQSNGVLFHKTIAIDIKHITAEMLTCLQLHISLSTIFLDCILLSSLLLQALSQSPQCPQTDEFLEWSGRDWVLKCSAGLPSSTSTPPGPACHTPACQKFSKRVLSALDLAVEPCQDFHQFACGNFKGEDTITEVTHIYKTKMVEILKQPPKPSQDKWEQHIR